MRLLLVLLLIVVIVGLLPHWPYSTHWGIYPSGGLGLLLLIIVILIVLGVL